MRLLMSRPGSQMRPLRRTCLSLQELRNMTKRKTTGTRKPEVRQADPANVTTTRCTVLLMISVFKRKFFCLHPSAMKTSVSMDSSDQKKTRLKLKKFLTRRPTYQAVRDKGYIKGIHTEYSTGVSSTLIVPHMMCVMTVFLLFHRSGVWLQFGQFVPEGEHICAQLRQNVHRPRGEHWYEQQPSCCILDPTVS